MLTARVILTTGKGGVGKTTLVVAMALAALEEGRRPLLVELGHRSSVAPSFGVEDVGFEPTELVDGLSACNVWPDEALRAFVTRQLPGGRLASRILTHGGLATFFRAAPAVNEIVTLARIRHLRDQGYDPVIVDLDATGHAEMLLELPEVLGRLEAGGPLAKFLDEATALLGAEDTVLHLVTLPGALPAQETIELYQRLAKRRINLGTLVINRVPPMPWRAPVPTLDRIEEQATDPDLRADVELVGRALDRHQRARWSIERLAKAVPLPRVELPRMPLVTPHDLPRALVARLREVA